MRKKRKGLTYSMIVCFMVVSLAVVLFPGSGEAPAIKDAKKNLSQHGTLRAVVFRVYDPNGAPVHGAEVLIKTRNPKVTINPKLARGSTVNGLRQTYVPCSGLNMPSQVLYEYEIWSAAGKTHKGSWWQPTNSWLCDETLDITVELKPVVSRIDKGKERKKLQRFDGYLFAKLVLIGSKSEGPSYILQQWDYKEIPVIKKVYPWEEDPVLHKFLAKKVTIMGNMMEEGIEYKKIKELQPADAAAKKLKLKLKVPELLWVNKMPGPGPIKQYMPMTLFVKWPYRSIWRGTCPTSQIYDFMIEKDGKTIWKWSDGKVFLQVITPVSIPGGRPVEYSVIWEFLPKKIKKEGIYTAKALFIASKQTVEKKFEIKFAH